MLGDRLFTCVLITAATALVLPAARSQVTVRFAQESSSISESAGTATIGVTIAYPYDWDMFGIDFLIVGGTATPWMDYLFQSSPTYFSPGLTSFDITVHVFDDDLPEDDETIAIQLSNPVNAVLTSSIMWVTIASSDPPGPCYFSMSPRPSSVPCAGTGSTPPRPAG